MTGKIYALFVGIDEYPPAVPGLEGCVNDVKDFGGFIKQEFGDRLALETLLNSDATYANIISGFRKHLQLAGKDDVVLFHYSGHGSQEASAREFLPYFPDGKNETLVCYDSRLPGGLDLADKELAILISEIAANGAHVAISLDCCHSGSGTRDAANLRKLNIRQSAFRQEERPLESYMDGYYLKQPLHYIPESRHVLMAACNRIEKAAEMTIASQHHGAFSASMLAVLQKFGAGTGYADLFVKTRQEILKNIQNQTPQFETYQNFNAYSGFLNSSMNESPAKYHVFFEDNGWKIDAGAIHGLPTDPTVQTRFTLHGQEQNGQPAKYAHAKAVGPQKSTLELEFDAQPEQAFKAEINSFPAPPFTVYFSSNENDREIFNNSKDDSLNITLTGDPKVAKYGIVNENGTWLLKHIETDLLIQGARGNASEAAPFLFSVLKKIMNWERTVELENRFTRFPDQAVDFISSEVDEKGNEKIIDGDDLVVDYRKVQGKWQDIQLVLRARNNSNQPLFFTLLYLSRKFSIMNILNQEIPEGEEVVLWGNDPRHRFMLAEGINESTDIFKLIVSTEKVDDFLLTQQGIKLGNIEEQFERHRDALIEEEETEKITNDWFTQTTRITTRRQIARLANEDMALANNKIVIKGHPSLKANVSIGSSKSHTRSADPETVIPNSFENSGIQLLDFSSTRGLNENALEITDIKNAAALKEEPLEIRLNMNLKGDEFILPVTFDGNDFLLGGFPEKDKDGNLSVFIDHIPETTEKTRGIGQGIKLTFFKLLLQKPSVNKLRWVDYSNTEKPVRKEDGLNEKLAEAKNALLLIHGMFDDTELMTKSLGTLKNENGKSVASNYDLVIAFDYESMNTSLEETAQWLKKELLKNSIEAGTEKKLNILAHSMGGLMARWLIEQEDGGKWVKQLIMAGTPNGGSAIANLVEYRNYAITLLTLSLNFFQALIPYTAPLLAILSQSKKITHALEEMKTNSPLLETLGLSKDPEIPYTVLAGDITHFASTSDKGFPHLLEKIGRGTGHLFYGDEPNDFAVSAASAKKLRLDRNPKPAFYDLSCHHMNYFTSKDGMKVLGEVM